MKNLILSCLLLVSITTQAQRHYYGINGALGITNFSPYINGNPIKYSKLSHNFEVIYEYQLFKKHRIATDVQYIQFGQSIRINFTDQYGNDIEEHSRLISRFNYLSIPIKWKFFPGKKGNFNISGGLAPSYLLSLAGRFPVTDVNGNVTQSKFNFTGSTKRFDLSTLIEISLEERISKNLVLNPSLVFRKSLIDFNKTLTMLDYHSRHYGIFLGVGLKYNKG